MEKEEMKAILTDAIEYIVLQTEAPDPCIAMDIARELAIVKINL